MQLEDAKDPSALDHWTAILPMASGAAARRVELAIATHDERCRR